METTLSSGVATKARLRWSRHFNLGNATTTSTNSMSSATDSKPINHQGNFNNKDNSATSTSSLSTTNSEPINDQDGFNFKDNSATSSASTSTLSMTSSEPINHQNEFQKKDNSAASSSSIYNSTTSSTTSSTKPPTTGSTPTTLKTIVQPINNPAVSSASTSDDPAASSTASITDPQVISGFTSSPSITSPFPVFSSSSSPSSSLPTHTSVTGPICDSGVLYPNLGPCNIPTGDIPPTSSSPIPSATSISNPINPLNTSPTGGPASLSRMIPSTLIAVLLLIALISRRKWIVATYRRFSQECPSSRRASYASGDLAPIREEIPLLEIRTPPPAYSPYRFSFDDSELMGHRLSINRVSLREPTESLRSLDSGDQIQPSDRLGSSDAELMEWPHLFGFEDRGPGDGPDRYSIVDRGPARAPNSPYRPSLADRELMGTAD